MWKLSHLAKSYDAPRCSQIWAWRLHCIILANWWWQEFHQNEWLICIMNVSCETIWKRGRWNIRAVYTGIKKPEFFSHSGFSLEVARQLPLNCKKNWIEKPTSEVFFFFLTLPVFHCFFANVNACSPLTGIIRVFGHVGRALLRNHPPRPATYCTLHTVKGREKSRMRTTYQKNSMRFGFYGACAFLAKNNPKSYGFFWQCKRYSKKPRIFGFWFLPM